MREALLAASLLFAACGDSTVQPTVKVVDLDGLNEQLPRALGKGALVNLWAMW